jgi:hypothetical protein
MIFASLLRSNVCATRKHWNALMENTALPKAEAADRVSPVIEVIRCLREAQTSNHKRKKGLP